MKTPSKISSRASEAGLVATSKVSRRWMAVATLTVIAAALAGWARWPAAPAHAQAAASAPQVVVSHPVSFTVGQSLHELGQFSARNQVELRAQVGGTLESVDFQDGALVHQGDLLFTIDPRPYQYRLAQAQASLQSAQSRLVLANQEWARAQALQHNQAGTVQDVEQRRAERDAAQAAVSAAQADIDDARFDLAHCRIVAPFTGRIGRHMVSVGNLVAGSRTGTAQTTLLATLVSVDPIYFDLDLSESDFQRLQNYRASAGAKSEVALTLSDGQAVSQPGVLDFLDNQIDHASGTLHARATVPNPKGLLTPGEFARASVEVGVPQPRLLVPDAAVLPDQSTHMVMVVDAQGVVQPRLVQPGELIGGLRIIEDGLKPDDRVIVGDLAYARPGMKVQVKEQDIAPPKAGAVASQQE